jgi:polysaccharide pyruvyl transferase WcaK-like protein
LKLAERWGTDCLRSDDHHHLRHEIKVRALYRRAALTISDRLHVLIIAMTEGSVPIAFAPNSAEKLSRPFQALGMDQVAFSAAQYGRDEALARITALESDADLLFDQLAVGRRRLTQLSRVIIASFGSEPVVY